MGLRRFERSFDNCPIRKAIILAARWFLGDCFLYGRAGKEHFINVDGV